MLATTKQNVLNELVSGASYQELVWMNGFLAGILAHSAESGAYSAAEASQGMKAPGRITIVYGTETGNSKSLAAKLAASAKKQGAGVKLAAMDQYRPGDLSREKYLLIVISTQGDGELPAPAVKFYEHVRDGVSGLEHLQYAVLALGDSSYPLFCKAGEDMDGVLEAKGAGRLLPLLKCDTDYEQPAAEWFRQVMETLSCRTGPSGAPHPVGTGMHNPGLTVSPVSPRHTKKMSSGAILRHINLNDRGSQKETYHVEIEAEGIAYEPGDSIGIVPENPESLVLRALALAGADPTREILYRDERNTLYHFLKKKLNIACLPDRTVRKYAELVRQDIPATKIGLEDLLKIYPLNNAHRFEQVIDILEPVTPRLYSISSSPSAHEGEVHITVALDRFRVQDEVRRGLCSGYISGLEEGTELSFYIHPNRSFRLPDPATDIIMIGPGTGIAPFRSFLAERDAVMAQGRNWLFFGDQHFTSDFLYQTEIQSWFETGLLTRVNTAFSRDQPEKIYVQHRMLEQGAELFNWLEQGASIYICGAKTPMSADVGQVLIRIIEEHGRRTEAEAIRYLDALTESSRYLKDVY